MSEITIPLDKGLHAKIDAEDWDRLKDFKWYESNGVVRCDYFDDGRKVCLSMHRFIMEAEPNAKVYHLDCDGLNNQKSNLVKVPCRRGNNSRVEGRPIPDRKPISRRSSTEFSHATRRVSIVDIPEEEELLDKLQRLPFGKGLRVPKALAVRLMKLAKRRRLELRTGKSRRATVCWIDKTD